MCRQCSGGGHGPRKMFLDNVTQGLRLRNISFDCKSKNMWFHETFPAMKMLFNQWNKDTTLSTKRISSLLWVHAEHSKRWSDLSNKIPTHVLRGKTRMMGRPCVVLGIFLGFLLPLNASLFLFQRKGHRMFHFVQQNCLLFLHLSVFNVKVIILCFRRSYTYYLVISFWRISFQHRSNCRMAIKSQFYCSTQIKSVRIFTNINMS